MSGLLLRFGRRQRIVVVDVADTARQPRRVLPVEEDREIGAVVDPAGRLRGRDDVRVGRALGDQVADEDLLVLQREVAGHPVVGRGAAGGERIAVQHPVHPAHLGADGGNRLLPAVEAARRASVDHHLEALGIRAGERAVGGALGRAGAERDLLA
jgi:hypothetical protein